MLQLVGLRCGSVTFLTFARLASPYLARGAVMPWVICGGWSYQLFGTQQSRQTTLPKLTQCLVCLLTGEQFFAQVIGGFFAMRLAHYPNKLFKF